MVGTEDLHNYAPKVWNDLLKVKLTPSSLNEHERRTWYDTTFLWIASVKRSIERQAFDPTTSKLSPEDLLRLRHLASTGEIDFSILRGYATINVEMPQFAYTGQARDPQLPRSIVKSYNSVWEQLMIQAGVIGPGAFPLTATSEPENLDSLLQILGRPRRPWTLAEEEIRRLARGMRTMTTWQSVLSLLVEDSDTPRHLFAKGVRFEGLDTFHKSVDSAQPSMYYGAEPALIHAAVRSELGRYIVPSKDTSLPAAPNLFLVFSKTEEENEQVIDRMALHSSAAGARAMFEIMNYGRSSPSDLVYDGNAYAAAAVVYRGLLTIYATFPRDSPSVDGSTEFLMVMVDRFDLCKAAGLIEGVNAFHNAREWARHHRERWILKANTAAGLQSG